MSQDPTLPGQPPNEALARGAGPAPAENTTVAATDRQPIFNAPTVVVVLTGLFCAVHAWLTWLPHVTRQWWTVALAVLPARFGNYYTAIPGEPWAIVTSLLTHTLVHADLLHLAVNTGMFLAIGAALARRIGTWRFLALFAASAIAGVAFYLGITVAFRDLNSPAVLVGASGAVSGLFGAMTRCLAGAALMVQHGLARDLGDAMTRAPRLPLTAALSHPTPRSMIVGWMIANALFGVFGSYLADGASIAWDAHLGGFIVGLFGFALFDRPNPKLPVPIA